GGGPVVASVVASVIASVVELHASVVGVASVVGSAVVDVDGDGSGSSLVLDGSVVPAVVPGSVASTPAVPLSSPWHAEVSASPINKRRIRRTLAKRGLTAQAVARPHAMVTPRACARATASRARGRACRRATASTRARSEPRGPAVAPGPAIAPPPR